MLYYRQLAMMPTKQEGGKMKTSFCRNCGYRVGDKPALGEGDFHYLWGNDCPVCGGEDGYLSNVIEREKVAKGGDIATLAMEWWGKKGYMPAPPDDIMKVYIKLTGIVLLINNIKPMRD